MKKLLNILWGFVKVVLAVILFLLLAAMGLSALVAGVIEKIFRIYKRVIVKILIAFRDEILGKKETLTSTAINEKVNTSEEIIAVLKNVKTGEKKVIRERWYHKILGLLK